MRSSKLKICVRYLRSQLTKLVFFFKYIWFLCSKWHLRCKNCRTENSLQPSQVIFFSFYPSWNIVWKVGEHSPLYTKARTWFGGCTSVDKMKTVALYIGWWWKGMIWIWKYKIILFKLFFTPSRKSIKIWSFHTGPH